MATAAAVWPWVTLVGLGAYHGLNPGMGWLFAVAIGLQERDRSAIRRSIVPIALGHAASVAAVLAIVVPAEALINQGDLRLTAAVLLIAFGGYRLLRVFQLVRGPRFEARVGMRVGFSDLMMWSFLMATAHGAGLMAVPAVLGLPVICGPGIASAPPLQIFLAVGGSIAQALAAVAVHTAAMLAVAVAIALVVFQWVGLAILRRGWINLDLLWSVALVGAGGLLLLL